MTQFTRTFLLMLALSALAACGRAGPLEPPPSSVAAPADDAGDSASEDAPKQDRPFILDGILN
ncbi:MAG: lipoprotein [Pseudomonadota bacterium]